MLKIVELVVLLLCAKMSAFNMRNWGWGSCMILLLEMIRTVNGFSFCNLDVASFEWVSMIKQLDLNLVAYGVCECQP